MMFKGGNVKDTKEEGMEKENEDKNKKSNGITIIIHKDKIPHPWDQDGVLKYVSIIHVVIGLVLLGASIYRDTADVDPWANNVFYTSLPQGYVSSALYTLTGVLGILTTCFKGKLMVNLFQLINIFAITWTGVLIGSSWRNILSYQYIRVSSDVGSTLHFIHFTCSIIQVITTFIGLIITYEYMFYSKPDKAMKSKMKSGTFTTLSRLQIFIGAFLITFFVCVDSPYDFGNSYIDEGVWCGIFFIVFGVTGCFVSRRASPRTVTPFILMNILGSIFAIVVMITAVNSVSDAPADYEIRKMNEKYLGYPQDFHEDLVAYLKTDDFNCTERTIEKYKYPSVNAEYPSVNAVLSPFIPYRYNHSDDKIYLDLDLSKYKEFGHSLLFKNVSLEETTSLEFLMDVDKCEEDRLKIISLDLSDVSDQIDARIAGIRVIYNVKLLVKLLVGIIAFIINVVCAGLSIRAMLARTRTSSSCSTSAASGEDTQQYSRMQ